VKIILISLLALAPTQSTSTDPSTSMANPAAPRPIDEDKGKAAMPSSQAASVSGAAPDAGPAAETTAVGAVPKQPEIPPNPDQPLNPLDKN
jgi:hypothetical protein